MTNQQGAPEALRLADAIDPFERKNAPDHITSKVAADELRRLHAENERLAALVEAQQPAPSAAPTQDMIAAVLQLVDLEQGDVEDHRYDDGSKLAEQICKAVLALAPQPSPTPQADSAPADPLQAFDSPRAKALMRAWEEGWEACRDAEYVGEEAQNDAFNSSHTLTLCIAEDQQLPAPQADSQPAPVVGTIAHIGTGKTTLTGAITSALRAASDTADSVTAPAKSEWDVRGHLATSLSFWHRLKNGEDDELVAAFRKWATPSCTTELDELRKAFRPHDLTQEWTSEHSRNYPGKAARIINAASAAVLTATATPPAQAADSVLEDAARLDWLELAGPTSICRVIDRPHDGEVEVATDDVTGYGKTLREALDAARKQGGKP